MIQLRFNPMIRLMMDDHAAIAGANYYDKH
jgi:hypothetical protein